MAAATASLPAVAADTPAGSTTGGAPTTTPSKSAAASASPAVSPPTTPMTVSPHGAADLTPGSGSGAPTAATSRPGALAPVLANPPGPPMSFPDLASTLPPADQEVVSARTRDQKHFRKPSGVEVAVFGHNLHYEASPGDWQDVDLHLRSSGPDYVADRNDVVVRVTPDAVLLTDRGGGRGIAWHAGARSDVSGQSVHFRDQELDWDYENTAAGVKQSAKVDARQGPRHYQFPYELVGGGPGLRVNDAGDAFGEGFVVPRATVISATGARIDPGPWHLTPGAIAFDFDDSALPPDAYPYVVDPTTTFQFPTSPSADDSAWVAGMSGAYPPPSATNQAAGTSVLNVGKDFMGPNQTNGRGMSCPGYSCYATTEGFARWNTASVPDDATVGCAKVEGYVGAVDRTNDPEVTVGFPAWWPIGPEDYNPNPIPAAYGPQYMHLHDVTPNSVLTLVSTLGPDGYINKTGYTGYEIALQGDDGAPTGRNGFQVQSPTLVVTYSQPIASNYHSAVLADNPISFWPLDEECGTVAADAQGRNSGNITGGVTLNQQPAISGNSMSFDGSTGYISLSGATSLQPTAGLTVEGWIMTNSTALQTVMRSRWYGYDVFLDAGLPFAWACGSAGPCAESVPEASPYKLQGIQPINDGRWHHLVLTKDATTSSLYVDGSVVASVPHTEPVHYAGAGVAIGRDGDGDFYYAAGKIDEVALYDHALSPARVAAHFGAAPRSQTGPAFGPMPREETYGPGDSPHGPQPQHHEAEPVNTATGAYSTEVTDATLPGIGVPFSFTRAYTSADPSTGPLGPGWTHAYNASLLVQGNGDIVFRDEGGAQYYYVRQPTGAYTTPPGGRSALVGLLGGWQLTRHDQVVYLFDTTGRLTSLRDRNGRGPSLAYNFAGQLSRVTDSAGRVVVFSYTAGLLDTVSMPDGRAVHYAYSGGRLASVTDLTGNATQYSYDGFGRLNRITDANGHYVVTNFYGSDGRVSSQYDAAGTLSRFTWDPNTQTSAYADGRGKTWSDVYVDNVLVRQVDGAGNASAYGYDATFNRTSVTDPRGATTTFGYDTAGNLTARGRPGLASETWLYNARNDAVSHTDSKANLTTFGYDGAGNLISITAPDSSVTRFGRDPAGSGLLTSVTDGRNKTTSYGYDAAGNRIRITTPAGEVTTIAYDNAGRPTSSVDPRGNVAGGNPSSYTTSFGYDNADRLTSTTDPLADTTTFTYDPVGNRARVTDANGHATVYGYDADNRLTSVTAPDAASVTSYGYDAVGNLVSRTVAGSHTTSFGYDADNRLSFVVSPIGQRWDYAYDAAGNRTSVTDAARHATTVVYDLAGRATDIAYTDPTVTPDVHFAYDANDNRTSMVDGAGQATYTYDSRDRLTSVVRAGDRFTYGYDAASNLMSRTYPDGTAYTLGYDGDERLASVAQGASSIASYAYDVAGHHTGTNLANSTSESRVWDRAGRLTGVVNSRGTSTISSFNATLDPIGNPTQVTDAGGSSTVYQYDVDDRLTKVCYATTSCTGAADYISWAYDAVGNRTSEARPAGTATYSYNNADQLLSTSGLNPTSFGYDANGNQTRAGSQTFAYDRANRMISSNPGATFSLTYAYDGDGRRISMGNTRDGQTSKLLWDINGPLDQIALDEAGVNTVAHRYAYGLSRISQTDFGTTSYYHYDRLGSVVNTTDASGNTQGSYAYEPFGTAKSSTGTGSNRMRFAGEHIDPTGLYYLRARQYDPGTGRFLQQDPLGLPSVAGRAGTQPGAVPFGLPTADPYVATYAYADGQPTVLTDPTGNCPWCVLAAGGAIVGGVVSGGVYAVRHHDDFSWRGLAGATAAGAIAGGVTAVAGPAAAGIVGSTGTAATGVAAGINAVGGAVAGAVGDYISQGCVSGESIVGGALVNAAGGYLGGRVAPAHGMDYPSQLPYFAPRTVAGMLRPGANMRAVYGSAVVGGTIGGASPAGQCSRK